MIMKIKRKITLLIVSYLILSIILILGTNYYIENKTNKLRKQSSERFENFFRNQNKFVDTRYANTTVRYSKITKPSNPLYSGENLDTWNEKYSDIYNFYKIDPTDNGWNLFVAGKFFPNTMVIYRIFPSYVGYLKQENSYTYNSIPSVETCVREAYEYWTNDSKSRYIDHYQRGNENRIKDLIRNVPNEYFGWNFDKDKIQLASANRMFSSEVLGRMGCISNNYYRVFSESTKWETYEIEKRSDVIERDKSLRLITGSIILTVILLSFLIPLIIQNISLEKKKREHD